ncbi:MAG TPA: CBS domain-containing protein, partial [Micromonosporaceae bacterium]
ERKAVSQVMRPTTTIEPRAHLDAGTYLIKHYHDPALVVMTNGTQEPVATITDADITKAIADGLDPEDTHVSQVVTAKHATVEADVAAEDAARLMLSHGVDRLPVFEGQRLVGVVELADLRRMGVAPTPFATAKSAS